MAEDRKQPNSENFTKEEMEKFGGGMAELTKSINALIELGKQGQAQAQQHVELQQQTVAQEAEEVSEEVRQQVTDTDLELMSNAQLVNYITDIVSRAISDQIKPIASSLDNVHTGVVNDRLNSMINSAASDPGRKDFWDWKDEMIELAKGHGTLSPIQIYNLARTGNPAKAKEMDRKYGLNGSGDDTRRKGGGKFGKSFSPQGAGGTIKNKKMDTATALETAWDAAIAKHGNPFEE